MMQVSVIDWGDEAFKEHGEPVAIAEIEVEQFTGFHFDGGRLDIIGHSETIWIQSHQWSLYVKKD
jgi:hypothetical protein